MKKPASRRLVAMVLALTLMVDSRLALNARELNVQASPTMSEQAIVPALGLFFLTYQVHIHSWIIHAAAAHLHSLDLSHPWPWIFTAVTLASAALPLTVDLFDSSDRLEKMQRIFRSAKSDFASGDLEKARLKLDYLWHGDPKENFADLDSLAGYQEVWELDAAITLRAHVSVLREKLDVLQNEWVPKLDDLGRAGPIGRGIQLGNVFGKYNSATRRAAASLLYRQAKQAIDTHPTDREFIRSVFLTVSSFMVLADQHGFYRLRIARHRLENLRLDVESILHYRVTAEMWTDFARACLQESHLMLLTFLIQPRVAETVTFRMDREVEWPQLMNAFLEYYPIRPRLVLAVVRLWFRDDFPKTIDYVERHWRATLKDRPQSEPIIDNSHALLQKLYILANYHPYIHPSLDSVQSLSVPSDNRISFYSLSRFAVREENRQWVFWPNKERGWIVQQDHFHHARSFFAGASVIPLGHGNLAIEVTISPDGWVDVYNPSFKVATILVPRPPHILIRDARVVNHNRHLFEEDMRESLKIRDYPWTPNGKPLQRAIDFDGWMSRTLPSLEQPHYIFEYQWTPAFELNYRLWLAIWRNGVPERVEVSKDWLHINVLEALKGKGPSTALGVAAAKPRHPVIRVYQYLRKMGNQGHQEYHDLADIYAIHIIPRIETWKYFIDPLDAAIELFREQLIDSPAHGAALIATYLRGQMMLNHQEVLMGREDEFTVPSSEMLEALAAEILSWLSPLEEYIINMHKGTEVPSKQVLAGQLTKPHSDYNEHVLNTGEGLPLSVAGNDPTFSRGPKRTLQMIFAKKLSVAG